ncbi:MAG: DUF547 domain-containing protein [Flavobacterium sp.]|nr:DUF547 domain-containing protein [Flavobacterium sp.]
MKKLLLIIVFFSLSTTIQAQGSGVFFDLTNVFLKKYVDANNKVNYQELKGNADMLNLIMDYAGKMNLKNESKETSKAFWINIYNLAVIKNVVDNYPMKSTMDIPGFFNENDFLIANQRLTLDDIEHTILREIFLDPGIHFVLVSGSNGGVQLKNEAYVPKDIDAQIKAEAAKYINNKDIIRIDKKSKIVELPKIFEWYTKDFVTFYTNEIDFLNIFLEKKIEKDYKVKIYEYDWTLNKKV